MLDHRYIQRAPLIQIADFDQVAQTLHVALHTQPGELSK